MWTQNNWGMYTRNMIQNNNKLDSLSLLSFSLITKCSEKNRCGNSSNTSLMLCVLFVLVFIFLRCRGRLGRLAAVLLISTGVVVWRRRLQLDARLCTGVGRQTQLVLLRQVWWNESGTNTLKRHNQEFARAGFLPRNHAFFQGTENLVKFGPHQTPGTFLDSFCTKLKTQTFTGSKFSLPYIWKAGARAGQIDQSLLFSHNFWQVYEARNTIRLLSLLQTCEW